MTREELLKIAKPILFNTEMVQAILEGRKTVTRRVLAEKEVLDKKWGLDEEPYKHNGKWYFERQTAVDDSRRHELKSRYQVGDTLYVRETFCEVPYEYEHIPMKNGHITVPKIAYRADSEIDYTGIWKPSIHMPKELARIFLKVTDVRVERLQDITEEQCLKEGIEGARCSCNGLAYACTDCYNTGWLEPPQVNFMFLWNSTIKKQDLDQYGWDANPWVWVIEFERVEE